MMEEECGTNFFPIKIEHHGTVIMYDVDIQTCYRKLNPDGTATEYTKVLNGNISYRKLLRKEAMDVFCRKQKIDNSVFDAARTLFVFEDIKCSTGLIMCEEFPISSEIRQYLEEREMFGVRITLNVISSFPFSSSALTAAVVTIHAEVVEESGDSGETVEDNNLQKMKRLMETACGQHVTRNNSYAKISQQRYLFLEQIDRGYKSVTVLHGALQWFETVRMAVKIRKDRSGEVQPILSVDYGSAAVYSSQYNLFESLCRACDLGMNKASTDRSYWTGEKIEYGTLFVQDCAIEYRPRDGKPCIFIAHDLRFPKDDAKSEPFPCVTARFRDGSIREYPINECSFVPRQILSKEKLLKLGLNPPAAIPPDQRWNRTMDHFRRMQFTELLNNGFVVFASPEPARYHKEVTPLVCYDGKTVQIEPGKTTWRSERYVRNGEPIDCWVFIAICDNKSNENPLSSSIDFLVREAEKRGIRGDRVKKVSIDDPNNYENEMESYFKEIDRDCSHPFVTFIDKKERQSHDFLKYLEAKYQICTQQVTLDIMLTKKNVFGNVINKMNVKLGGVNHMIKPRQTMENEFLNDPSLLIFAMDVSHPPPNSQVWMKLPSTVGVSFNTPQTYAFIGDFFYQEGRKEEVESDQLEEVFRDVLERFKLARREYPKKVLLLRDGVSDRQEKMVLEKEVASMKNAVSNLDDCSPLFVAVVCRKRHNARFYSSDYKKNVHPGTVVDHDVVDAGKVPEFYLGSHKPLQGTSKNPCFRVILDEVGLTRESVETVMNALSFSHQITGISTSLPTPIFVAHEAAKRGANNYQQLRRREPEYAADYRTATEMLGYKGKKLGNVRYNA